MTTTETAKAWSRASVLTALATQAIGSGTSFGVTLLLLNHLTPYEYGVFGIGLAIVMLGAGCWQSFFTTQYVVCAPKEDSGFGERVYSAMGLVAAGASVLVVGAAALLEYFFGLGGLALGTGLAGAAFAFKEFHIRHAFASGCPGHAVSVNAVLGASVLATSTCAPLGTLDLDGSTALGGYAALLTVAALYGHIRSGLSICRGTWRERLCTLKGLSVGGKWAVLTSTVFAIRHNAHILVVGMMLGVASIAQINAARLFLTPAILLLPASSTVVLPEFARAVNAGGGSGLLRAQIRVGTALVTLSLAYSLVLVVSWPLWDQRLNGVGYQNLGPLVGAWGIYVGALLVRSLVDWGAQAQRRFATVTKASVLVAGFSVVAAIAFTAWGGSIGSVIALATGEIVLATLLHASLRGGGVRRRCAPW